MRIPWGIRLRVAIFLLLFLGPVLGMAALGSYYLWEHGWLLWSWLISAVCMVAAYGLGWYWTRNRSGLVLPPPSQRQAQDYWTERDLQAWKIVQQYADASRKLRMDEIADHERYAADAQELALKIAQVYQPETSDPFSHLTLPEILTCGELLTQDLSHMVGRYVPGSHLVTIGTMTRMGKAANTASAWYPTARDAYFAFTALTDPVRAATQFLGTRVGMSPLFKELQQNVLTWFHALYVTELGRYLIELNSGRLKVGAKRYRELMGTKPEDKDVATPPATVARADADALKITVIGPVKAGKSSLVNAILGGQMAGTDVLPLTDGMIGYSLQLPELPALTLIDTPGFAYEGPTDADLDLALKAGRNADLMLFVLPANSAAREPEVRFYERLRAKFETEPGLRFPPVLIVLSRIDLLSPKAEWQPPYDWQHGKKPKEQNIREAVLALQQLFATPAELQVVPVCSHPERLFGVQPQLIDAVAQRLGQAKGTAVSRIIHDDSRQRPWGRVVDQVKNTGKLAAHILGRGFKR